MSPNAVRAFASALLLCLMAAITLAMQSWVGDQTIYAKALDDKREAFHFAILKNEAPGGGSWSSVGAQSIQKRVGVVYLAEYIRAHSSLTVKQIYKLLDSVFLFLALIGLYFFLRNWLPDLYCLVGVLYFSSFLPLTYHFQLFHPWDRIQLAGWILLLWLIYTRSFFALAVVLILSILIKFDTVLLPFLYGLVHFRRTDKLRVAVEVGLLLTVGFGTYVALGVMFPAPLDQSHFTIHGVLSMFEANTRAIGELRLRYPPLLVYMVPLALVFFGLRSRPRFVWASVVFGLMLTLIYATFIHYEEVRTHIVVLVLLLPAALLAARDLISRLPEWVPRVDRK